MRTMVINDEPWFVGKDVASVLGYERADNAIRSHVEEEDKLMHQISASGQRRQMTIINVSGLYALILSSKLPEAEGFQALGDIRGAWADKEDGRLYSDKWLRFGSMVL